MTKPYTVTIDKSIRNILLCIDRKEESAFQAIKALIIKDTLLIYPDYSKPFIIEMDANNYQFRGVIKQYNPHKNNIFLLLSTPAN